MIPKFTGIVKLGKLKLHNELAYSNYLLTLVGEVEVLISRPRKPRSNEENRYYWGVVIEILSSELGYTPEEMHEALKFKFLRTHEGKLPSVKSTTDLSTSEMEHYLSQIREFASIELNCYIPEPNEVKF